jgi:hypothetical protein
MSTWEYRVIRSRRLVPDSLKEFYRNKPYMYSYDIREVYYVEGEPKVPDETWIQGTTSDGASAYGETMDELRQDFALLESALKKPVLDEWKIKGMPSD